MGDSRYQPDYENSTFELGDEFFEGREIFCQGFDPDPRGQWQREEVAIGEEYFWSVHFCLDLKMTREEMEMTPGLSGDLDVEDVWLLAVTDYLQGRPIPLCDFAQFTRAYPDWERKMARVALDNIRSTIN